MGYDSADHWTTKAAVVADLLRDARAEYEVLAGQTTKSGLWLAVRNKAGQAFIIFNLIERERGRYYAKSMSESMHPFYYDCPIYLLTLVPEGRSDWRAKVREHHGVAP